MKAALPSIKQIVERVSNQTFGKPLVTNVLRGHVVEAILAMALEPEWRWCAGDYSSFDFERGDGKRLEVKQSAARQSWAPPAHGRVNPSFDIKERTGRWEGSVFIAEPGRTAHIYVFAFHPLLDSDTDHRNPAQWEFYPVLTADLPSIQRIGLGSVRHLACNAGFAEVKDAVSSLLS